MRWLLSLGLLAGTGAAILASRKNLASRKKRRSKPLGYDPYASLFKTKSSDVNPAYQPPRADEDECLVIGREHRLNPQAPYRVCLTDNQKHVLFGGKRPQNLKKLGCGVFACAYSTPKRSRVVKFTRDSEDVAALLHAQKTGVVPKVYATYKLKDGGHSMRTNQSAPIYALVMERLRTIPEAEREEIDFSLMEINDVGSGYITGDDFCDNKGGCDDLELGVVTIAEKLHKVGIKWGDIHAGNIGYDAHGKLKALDLGLTKTQLKRRLKILAGIGRASKRLAGLRLVP